MSSHSATALHSVTPAQDDAGGVDAVLELTCGCVVRRRISADRIVEVVDGTRLVVGKYPCPVGHPVRPPSRSPGE